MRARGGAGGAIGIIGSIGSIGLIGGIGGIGTLGKDMNDPPSLVEKLKPFFSRSLARPSVTFTVRVRPHHPDLTVPFVPGLIRWADGVRMEAFAGV